MKRQNWTVDRKVTEEKERKGKMFYAKKEKVSQWEETDGKEGKGNERKMKVRRLVDRKTMQKDRRR